MQQEKKADAKVDEKKADEKAPEASAASPAAAAPAGAAPTAPAASDADKDKSTKDKPKEKEHKGPILVGTHPHPLFYKHKISGHECDLCGTDVDGGWCVRSLVVLLR